jgi:hypothetical protein
MGSLLKNCWVTGPMKEADFVPTLEHHCGHGFIC